MKVFISCVSQTMSHPSAQLARRLESEGVKVLCLFKDSRSLSLIFKDAVCLFRFLSINSAHISELTSNVNGSISRFIISFISLLYGIKNTSFYIMDVYPGSLKFLTKKWYCFYPFFFVLECFSLLLVKKIIVIDEGFCKLNPLKLFSNKIILERLLFKVVNDASVMEDKNSIGIIGNLSNDFIINNMGKIERLSSLYPMLLATSNEPPQCLIDIANERFVSWLKGDTEAVFSKMRFNLICADLNRLTYCSPSKIIDSYMRGIIPVLFVNEEELNHLKKRDIYRYCISIESLLFSSYDNSQYEKDVAIITKHSRKWL